MIHTKQFSLLALLLCITAQAYAVRVAHPALKRELQAYFAAHGDSLSPQARSVCACLEKGQSVDKETLTHVLREAQNHGFSMRKQKSHVARTRTQQLN